MNKYLVAFLAAGIIPGALLLAQDDSTGIVNPVGGMNLLQSPSPTPSPAAAPVTPDPGITTITATKGSTFDGKAKVAVLTGNVTIVNPQFTLSSDKVIVYFHNDAADPKKAPGTKKPSTPAPSPPPQFAALGAGAGQAGNIDKVIAEGNTTISSDRPDPDGGPPVHYAGKASKVEYNPATGEMILSGLPQLQKGVDTLVATDDSTVIYLSREGKMHADGPHKITISDPGPDKIPQPKQSGTQPSEMK